MGWSSFEVNPGTPTIDVLRGEFREASIVDHSVRGNTAYLAVKEKDGDDIFGVVVLTSRGKDTGFGYNFAYKVVSEEMGPREFDCPARILNKLSPTTSEYALEWRAKCRTKAALVKKNGKLPVGATIQMADPIRFTDGTSAQTFRYNGQSSFSLVSVDHHFRVKISNWKDRKFTVVQEYKEFTSI